MSEKNDEKGGGMNLSLSNIDPEDAFRAFMQVDPEKVKGRLQEEGRDRQQGDEE